MERSARIFFFTILVAAASTGVAFGQEAYEEFGIDARRGPVIGVEIGPNFVVVDDDISDDSAGIGFAGRLGYRLTANLFEVTPEIKLGFESPGTPNAFQAMGGARIGLGTVVTPVAFGHVGGLIGDLEGFVWDAGGGVQLNIKDVSFGLEASYNRAESQELDFDGVQLLDGEESWEWVRANATVTLTL